MSAVAHQRRAPVRGEKTSFETLATTLAVTKAIKKVGVVVGVCDGFVGNRMIHKYLAEAQYMLEEGALPHEVDGPIYELGFAMGPLTMASNRRSPKSEVPA